MSDRIWSGQDAHTFLEMKLPSQVRNQSCIRLYCKRLEPRHREEIRHSHLAIEFDMFSGDCKGTYVIGNKSYSIESGDIFILRSNEQHSIVRLEGRQCVCTGLQLSPDFIWSPSNDLGDLSYIYEVFVGSETNFNHKIPREGSLMANVKRELDDIVHEFNQKDKGYSLMVKMKLVTILVMLARQLMGENGPSKRIQGEKRVMIEKTLNYLDDHYLEPLTLKEISKSVNMSPSYLEQLFKMLNGFSVWDYVVSKRIEAAKKQLASTNLRILDVSLQSGFNSLTYFNRIFKRSLGMSPKEYRKRILSSDSDSLME
jgi:AraC-like DNA-binding protein